MEWEHFIQLLVGLVIVVWFCKSMLNYLDGKGFTFRTTCSGCVQARYAGCNAIETMVMDRAREKGYDTVKVWRDLLQ